MAAATDSHAPTGPWSEGEITADVHSWKGRDILSVKQFRRDALEKLCSVATRMKATVEESGGSDLLKRKLLATVFYEPSTRTQCSFTAAMQRLGGEVMAVNESSSSVKKGETLSDTIKCLECYCDAIVLRHPVTGSAAEAATAASVPILNAGDGVGEHPTQALLDLYTIESEKGSLADLTVTMVGDLKNGRTVHSLARVLVHFGIRMIFVAPAILRLPEDVRAELAAAGATFVEAESLDAPASADSDASVLAVSDVLYVTRVQKERFADPEEYARVQGSYVINKATLARAKETLTVMHPLPRVGEIAEEVDDDPRAAYFRQMRNGLYVRMAILALIFGRWEE